MLMGMNSDKKHRHQGQLVKILIIILSFLIILAITLMITLPKIKASFDTSGVIPLIKQHLNDKESQQKELLLSLYFPIVSSNDSSHRYTKTSVMIKNDSLIVHNFIEKLINAVPQGALIEGAISFIPPQTTLIGYSAVNSIGYVHFSGEFLNATIYEEGTSLRYEQVRKNLRENFSLVDVVFIVNDEVINQ